MSDSKITGCVDSETMTKLLNRLTRFANGEIELSGHEVEAITTIVNKVIPDVKPVSLEEILEE